MTEILRLSVPMTVWLAAFSAVYGLEGLVCSDRWPAAAGRREALVAAWLLAVGMQVGMLLALRSPRFASPSALLRRIGLALAAVALVATAWTLLPVVAASLCL